jgi:hypothetical protein
MAEIHPAGTHATRRGDSQTGHIRKAQQFVDHCWTAQEDHIILTFTEPFGRRIAVKETLRKKVIVILAAIAW